MILGGNATRVEYKQQIRHRTVEYGQRRLPGTFNERVGGNQPVPDEPRDGTRLDTGTPFHELCIG